MAFIDESTTSDVSHSSQTIEKFEEVFERVQANRKKMKEGRDAVMTFRLLGLLKDEGCGELRKWDKIP